MKRELKFLTASICVMLFACILTGVIIYRMFYTDDDYFCIHLTEKQIFNDVANNSESEEKCFHSAKELKKYAEQRKYEKMFKDNEAVAEMFKSRGQNQVLQYPQNH